MSIMKDGVRKGAAKKMIRRSIQWLSALAVAANLFLAPCYGMNAKKTLCETSPNSDKISYVDNGLFFIDRNPNSIKTDTNYTGVIKWEFMDYLFSYKDGKAVKFNPEVCGVLERDAAGRYVCKNEQLKNALDAFLAAYNSGTGYDAVYGETDSLIEVNAFEMLLSQALSNDLLKAGQINILDVEYDASRPDHYKLAMAGRDQVEKFRNELRATGAYLEECDRALAGVSDPAEKVRRIDDLVCRKLSYNKECTVKFGQQEAHSEIDAICYGTGTVCAGYCNLFKLLCSRYGIEAKSVTDWGINHAWSETKIGGVWYCTDSTRNDYSGSKDYLLLTEAQMAECNKTEFKD